MSNGKHIMQKAAPSKNKKLFLLIAAVAIILSLTVGATLAWLSASTGAKTNTFTPANVTCRIDETVSGGVKSVVKVANTGTTDAYIRAAVIANSVNEKGEINGAADVSFTPGTGWVKSGSYYYYTTPVAPQGTTENLLGSAINLEGKQVTILSEAIQSNPASAVTDAWGWTPAA